MALTLFTAACATSTVETDAGFDSVRERLSADAPTRLYIGSEASTGVVTARRWTEAGWVEGDSTLVIDSGEVKAKVDGAGQLKLDTFEVALAPIEIPEEVFDRPAQLSDVKVKLVEAAQGAAVWNSDNEATARLSLKLDLEWAITVNGGKTPLGEQHLPTIDVDFSLAGDGEHVAASIALAATGELWNWAGLIEMTRLQLDLGAETTD